MEIRLLLKGVSNFNKDMIALKLVPVINEEWTKSKIQVSAGIKNKNKVKLPKEFTLYAKGSVAEWKNFKNLFTKPIVLDFVDDERELQNSAIAKALEQTKKEMGVSNRTKLLGDNNKGIDPDLESIISEFEELENVDFHEAFSDIYKRLRKLEDKS